jgi:hypothetical protein
VIYLLNRCKAKTCTGAESFAIFRRQSQRWLLMTLGRSRSGGIGKLFQSLLHRRQ